MDIPPLAGKIAALSLGAVPVSYALNHVSALSQCVRGVGGWVEDGEEGLEGAEGAGERMRARRALHPLAAPAREDGGWVRTPNRKSSSRWPRVCVLGVGVPLGCLRSE